MDNDIVKHVLERVIQVVHKPTMTISSFLKKFIFIACCGQPFLGWTQPELEGCVWTQFFHEDGALASEGCLVNGLPVGLWTNFDPQGNILSRGERVNNQPHGVWQFYQGGVLKEEATFMNGSKEGPQMFWTENIMTDSINWVKGKKEGWAFRFDSKGGLKMKTPYKGDQKEGKAVTCNAEGLPHGHRWFKNDRLVASEDFNRFDSEGLKTGPWKVFHPSGREVETGFYEAGLKHGVFQFFDARGKLQRVVTYRNGVEVVLKEDDKPQVEVMSILREDGSVSETVTYMNGVKDGVTRRFDMDGQVVGGALFENDVLAAEGVTTEEGKREGPWKEFWPDGSLKKEGSYANGLKEGRWVFYRRSGEKEQEGVYLNNDVHGTWTWWYADGALHREESYHKGEPEGAFLELDTAGEALVLGQYVAGEREGMWRVHVNDHVEEGSYLAGQKHGKWTHTYGSGKRQFEGEFDFGQPVGKHQQWHPNGVLEEAGKYEGGAKHKKWKLYDEAGVLLHEYIYRYGTLHKVDGSKVDQRRDSKLKGN